jgi:hypothetical protein
MHIIDGFRERHAFIFNSYYKYIFDIIYSLNVFIWICMIF